jgi:HTH-type transcriptional regulator/antitoxin MqsA
MVRDIRDASRTYNGEIITVVAVDAWFCEGCGEIEFAGADEASRYSTEVRIAMAAINASRAAGLRATRKRLGLKQAEAAAIFGGGVNAFSEYERGVRQPSKSTMLLLKLLDQHPELLKEIRSGV